MISQPFFLSQDGLYAVSQNTTLVKINADLSDGEPVDSNVATHILDTSQLKGICVLNNGHQYALATDYVKEIVWLHKYTDGVWDSGTAIEGFEGLRPLSIIPVGSKLWISATNLDFEDAFFEIDPKNWKVNRVFPEFGQEPPSIQAYGWPWLIQSQDEVILYCSVLGVVQWIDPSWKVTNCYELSGKAIVGPSWNEGVVYLLPNQDKWELRRLVQSGRDVLIKEIKLEGQPNGVCIDKNGTVWVSDEDFFVKKIIP